MFRTNPEPISEDALNETQVAERLASPLTRVVGACSLIALFGWAYGGLWASDFAIQRFVMINVGMYLSLDLERRDQSAVSVLPIDENPPDDLEGVEDPLAEAERLLELERQRNPNIGSSVNTSRPERLKELAASMQRMQYAQKVIAASWGVMMILAGVFMLCASVSALSGSHRARAWHRQVAYWTFLATACTVGGIWALVKWGGFPEIPDLWILAKIGAVQSSYAIAIIVALIATHRRAASA